MSLRVDINLLQFATGTCGQDPIVRVVKPKIEMLINHPIIV
jgi:hypothetical protein